MIWIGQLALFSQATKEVVEITVPGSLEEVLNNLESSRFESLTIKGGLNAADFIYLNSGKDKVAMIETLDLSDVILVPDDTPYSTINVGRSGGPSGYTYHVYYISDTYEVHEESSSNGLGGSNMYYHIYCDDLSGAFYGNNAFEKIILPKTLPNVGEYILGNNLSYNTTLKEIILPENASIIGAAAFSNCRALEKIELPYTLTAIEAGSFSNTAIKNLTLPSSTVKIGDGAFYQSAITDINLENVESIGSIAFAYAANLTGEINLSKVNTIREGCFSGTGISSIIFSSNLKEIGNDAFSGYKGIELTFPESLEKIGEYAFSRSENITTIILPENIERIGSRAFYNCSNLEEVYVPSSILQIGNYAFEGTPWGKKIPVENGIRYIANVAYDYDFSYKPQQETITFRDGTVAISDEFLFPSEVKEEVKTIQFPESLLEIGNNSFSSFKALGEVKLPSSLKRIGQQAFAECPKFWCTLPEKLESLEYRAFYGCKTLSQATLPENLQYIGEEVFSYSSVGTVRINSRNLNFLSTSSATGGTIFGMGSSLKKAIIGPNVTRLFDWMFGGTETLQTVEFIDPDISQLTYIGERCFSGCALINSTDNTLLVKDLPSSIEHIGEEAFGACTFSNELNLKRIKYLGDAAFAYCSGIEAIVIPETADTIGGKVFNNCPDLKHVEFNAKDFVTIPDKNYDSPYIFADCESLKTVIVGPAVPNLTQGMFSDCRNLESVKFMSADTYSANPLTIHDYAFVGCRNLSTLELPERVDSIGREFIRGTSLQSITVPTTCKFLEKYAFDGNLESIYFYSEMPPSFGGPITDRSWEYAQELTIYVPEESLELYKSESDLWRYKLIGLQTSTVDDIKSSDSNLQIEAVYDINGRNVIEGWSNLSKGIYILKFSDGTSCKVVR